MHHKITLPSIFDSYYTTYSEIHNYSTRQNDDLHVVSFNTFYGQRCLQYEGSVLWNNLPNTLKINMTVNFF